MEREVSSQVAEYLDAYRDFVSKRDVVSKVVTRMSSMATAIRNKPREFLHFNCGVPMRFTESRKVENIVFDMDAVPTGKEIVTAMTELSSAYDRCHEAWSAIDADNRHALTSPPDHLVSPF